MVAHRHTANSMQQHYTQRTRCMFCQSEQLVPHFEKDHTIAMGCYCVQKDDPCHYMPYNVLRCEGCKTYQTAYLGDLDIIYNYSANAFGNIRGTMNELFARFVLENPHIGHVLEIGAGNGELSERIMEGKEVLYEIVDPTYSGPRERRKVHKTFLEQLCPGDLCADTLIMSHVFEHFYEPIRTLEKIRNATTIRYIYLNFPDLEKCIQKDNYHVLNPEHIYYVENQFVAQLFRRYGFSMKRTYSHCDHSVFFEFERCNDPIGTSVVLYNDHSERDVPLFFGRIQERIEQIHRCIQGTDKAVYIWPCSMHTVYLIALGLQHHLLKGVLDNSPHKIGSYLYGSKLPCLSMEDTLRTEEPKIVILNGGCYNQEIHDRYPNTTFV